MSKSLILILAGLLIATSKILAAPQIETLQGDIANEAIPMNRLTFQVHAVFLGHD